MENGGERGWMDGMYPGTDPLLEQLMRGNQNPYLPQGNIGAQPLLPQGPQQTGVVFPNGPPQPGQIGSPSNPFTMAQVQQAMGPPPSTPPQGRQPTFQGSQQPMGRSGNPMADVLQFGTSNPMFDTGR